MLDVQVHLPDGSREDFTDIDYVSLVNGETFGPPPLVAPSRTSDTPRAEVEDKVLYINTSVVPAFLIERTTP